ncbi:MAG: hypothetical protein QFC78_06970 [Pseudomonadota bacterium]|nr:hypothetical protein [Pseudomonadota bacterium]
MELPTNTLGVLDQLLELGFTEFVERARARNFNRLFEDWKAPAGRDETDDAAWSNGAMIRSFSQTAIPKIFAGFLDPGARREIRAMASVEHSRLCSPDRNITTSR